MSRQMPSLNGLRAFEAAGRHGSFKAAAEELNVTQAAVSQMVRLLERHLGFALFHRHANRLELTDQGRSFQPGLTEAFAAIAAARLDPVVQAQYRALLYAKAEPLAEKGNLKIAGQTMTRPLLRELQVTNYLELGRLSDDPQVRSAYIDQANSLRPWSLL